MALWTFLALTMVATLYFGWHYVVDDIAGIGIGVIAVVLAGVATGHLRPAVPVAWRPVIPNALTLGRIAMMPAVVWLLLANDGLSLTAAALFAAASLTDLYDGALARRWQVQSDFGALADPFADKLLFLGSLAASRRRPRPRLGRRRDRCPRGVGDAAAQYAKRSGVVIAAGPFGKAKMVVQVFVVLTLIAVDLTGAALYVPLYAMVAITIASGVEIGLRARRRLAAPVPAHARVIAGAS